MLTATPQRPNLTSRRPKYHNAAILVLRKTDTEWLTALEFRKAGRHKDLLCTAGGKPEVEDTYEPRRTAARELKEETGLVRKPSELIPLGRSLRPNGNPDLFLHEFATILHPGESLTEGWMELPIAEVLTRKDVVPSVLPMLEKAKHLLT